MTRFRLTLLVSVLTMVIAAGPAAAQLGDLLKQLPTVPGGVPSTGSLGEVKIGQGLKEALQVGTANAVSLTGRADGYFKNEAIKILMPEQLKTVERGLRTVGYGPQVDELVLSMNRAAEQAAPAAKNIFWNAIGEMTIDDAQKILNGNNTAATTYFKGKTTPQLTAAFTPVVEKSMSQVGVTQQYEQLLGRAKAIPFLNTESYDINHYVVSKSLDGLFHVVGEQEAQIRANPAARTTELLKEVFGRK
jgi:Protein of unknown function (DUF4197)